MTDESKSSTDPLSPRRPSSPPVVATDNTNPNGCTEIVACSPATSNQQSVIHNCNFDDLCYICLCDLIAPCFADGCLHVFCTQCLLEWSKQSNRCPACRTVFQNLICNVIDDHLYEEIPVPGPSWSSMLNVSTYWDSIIESMVNNLQNIINLAPFSPRAIISNSHELPLRSSHLTTTNHHHHHQQHVTSSTAATTTISEITGPTTIIDDIVNGNEDQEEPGQQSAGGPLPLLFSAGWTLVRNRRYRRNRINNNSETPNPANQDIEQDPSLVDTKSTNIEPSFDNN